MPPATKPTTFIDEIKSLTSGTGISRPASQVIRNFTTAAMVSKLVKPPAYLDQRRMEELENGNAAITANGIQDISQAIMLRIEDNENVFRLFPDIELAVQILISSILSPKDMINSDLIYRVSDTTRLPSAMCAALCTFIKTEINKHYGLEEEMHEILKDALFRSGSHVKLTLPESAVDEVINSGFTVAKESIYTPDLFTGSQKKLKTIGRLGNRSNTAVKDRNIFAALESAANYHSSGYDPRVQLLDDEVLAFEKLQPKEEAYLKIGALNDIIKNSVEVIDNPQVLKIPELMEKVRNDRAEELFPSSLSTVSFAKETIQMINATPNIGRSTDIRPEELMQTLYKSVKTDYKPFVSVPSPNNLKRRSVGRPLRMTLSSAAAIPVYSPGDYRRHIGYFIPLDENSHPVTVDTIRTEVGNRVSSIFQNERTNTSISSMLTEKARKNLDTIGDTPIIDRLTDLYASIVERDLTDRLMKGSYSQSFSISRNTEIYQIMLARSLKGQMTRLIYVPAEYVSYYAFNYNRNGTGKSYLDDLSNITSLRAMVLFSKVMAKIKSSIAITHAHITLDERDSDPIKTIELAKHLVAKSRQTIFPHGLNRVVDITDWLQRAGVEITYDNHPRMPKTKFEFESKEIKHSEPDDTLDEQFRHQTYMHFGLSPETVDSAAKTEFATTIEKNSILFTRRVILLSNIFSICLTEDVNRIIKADQEILKEMAKIVAQFKGELEAVMDEKEIALTQQNPEQFIKMVLTEFLSVLKVDLPKPESTRTENLDAAFTAKESAVDKALNFYFGTDVIPSELGGEVTSHLDAVKNAWKASIMRSWMADNNFQMDVAAITNISSDGQPMANLLDITKSHSEAVMLNIIQYIKKLEAARKATERDLAKLNVEEGSSSGGSSYSDSESDEEGGGEENPFDNPEGGTEDEEASPFDEAMDEGGEDDAGGEEGGPFAGF